MPWPMTGRQQDMEGEFPELLCFVLVQRPKDRTIQHINQHSNLLHGSFLVHVSGICRFIWGHRGPILTERESPSSSWMHISERGCWDHTWGICGWRWFPLRQQDKINWQQGQQSQWDDLHVKCTLSTWQDGHPQQVYPLWAPHLQSIAANCCGWECPPCRHWWPGQIDAMALPFEPPLFPKAEAACPQWQDPQEIVEAQAPQVRWLSI